MDNSFVFMIDFLKKVPLMLLTAIFALSCSDDMIRPETTWLNIYLEDSPADYQMATMQFSSAQIFNGTEWKPLTITKSPIALLELTGGTNLNIISQPIDPGTYTKLKLRISDQGNSLTTGDSTYKLFVAPEHEYLEMDMELHAKKDEYNYMYCDIDAAKTFIAVDDTTYRMQPVGKMIDPLQWGAISGFVTDSKEVRLDKTILVEILHGDQIVASTYTNKKTAGFFVRLPQGDYKINITPGKTEALLPATVNSVVVKKAENSSVGNVALSEKL